MKLTRPADVAKARAAIPVRLMLFDLLSDGGKDLRRLPFAKRRQRLEEFHQPSECPVELSPSWTTGSSTSWRARRNWASRA